MTYVEEKYACFVLDIYIRSRVNRIRFNTWRMRNR